MQIEKNIAATLKNEMIKYGENLVSFSERLDIPVSTLQGYLKGTTSPRADTLELLAGKLGITPAELISGMRFSCTPEGLCLDAVALELQGLHPHMKALGETALALLRDIFSASDDLLGRGGPEEAPSNPYQYIPYEMRVPFQQTVNYGLLAKERLPSGWATVAVVVAFSSDKEAVDQLARTCTELQLSPEHLLDVVHDFIAQGPSPDC